MSVSTHRRSSVNPLPSLPSSSPSTSTSKKTPSLLKRLSRSSSSNNNNKTSSVRNTSTAALPTEKRSGSLFRAVVAPLRRRTLGNTRHSSTMQQHPTAATQALPSPLCAFLQGTCPQDVLPKILAFAGPHTAAVLQKTNQFWANVVQQEGTWRVLCEELYKWKLGEPEPESWLEHYRVTPCVPTDYPSIHAAMAIASGHAATSTRSNRGDRPDEHTQRRSIRILLRPGTHYLKEALNIQALNGATVTIETIQLPKNLFQAPRTARSSGQLQEQGPAVAAAALSNNNKRNHPIRNFLSRARSGSGDYTGAVVVEETDYSDSSYLSEDWMDLLPEPPKHATLVLRTRRHNEPAFRIRQGTVTLSNIEIQHTSCGIDIWNGNAAIQIQPPMGADDSPLPVVGSRPIAVLKDVKITSRSGRGIVNIDGGNLFMSRCAVHDCAATGIYVGGQGSCAVVEQTDVVRNGIGNRHSRRGIARGHSGVYLEQGDARISDCNVSMNTLTGISSVSPDNSFLTLESSELTMNGTYQLEIPAPGTIARGRSITVDNTFSAITAGRQRSGLLPETASNMRSKPVVG